MNVTRPNSLIGRDVVKTGCLTMNPLKTIDRLPEKFKVRGDWLNTIIIR